MFTSVCLLAMSNFVSGVKIVYVVQFIVSYAVTAPVCRYNQWRCNNGQCITASARCNGNHYDCRDGSDERFCPSLTTSTPSPTIITRQGSQQTTRKWLALELLAYVLDFLLNSTQTQEGW